MNAQWLENLISPEQKEQFETQGYLVIEKALSETQVAELTRETDKVHSGELEKGFSPTEALFYPNFLPVNKAFLDLVDYAKVLPKVWGILGWNIYLYHAHMIITPPSGKTDEGRTFGWHQDSGRVNREIESHPRPRLSLKVAYFLSDLSEPGRGNFWVVPASHLPDTLEMPPEGMGQPEGAIPVLVKPGDAVLFDRRIWHAGSPNWSTHTRKVLFYGYGYRWIRTKDNMTVSSLWEASDPIRKQLLGYGNNCNGFYSPSDEDVPLKVWMRDNDLPIMD